MGGAGFTRTSDTTLTAASTTAVVLEVLLHTEESAAAAAGWIKALSDAVKAEAARATLAEKDAAHNAAWEGLWGRSYIDVSVSTGGPGPGLGFASPDDVEAVNDAYVWQRFLDLADGRNTWGVIKFNGQAFTTSLNGTQGGRRGGVVSADYRDWGPSNWIQNTRQPYYAAVAAGDSDVLVGILRYFNRSLAVARARVNATFGIGGAYWPETSTLFGTYDAAGLGYGCNGAGTAKSPFAQGKSGRSGAGPTVPAVNGYTRFYTSGSLEVCFLGLEEYLTSGDTGMLQSLTLPICDAVTQFYRERFPSLNKTTGKTDLFPGQVIESCKDPVVPPRTPTLRMDFAVIRHSNAALGSLARTLTHHTRHTCRLVRQRGRRHQRMGPHRRRRQACPALRPERVPDQRRARCSRAPRGAVQAGEAAVSRGPRPVRSEQGGLEAVARHATGARHRALPLWRPLRARASEPGLPPVHGLPQVQQHHVLVQRPHPMQSADRDVDGRGHRWRLRRDTGAQS